MVTNRRSSHRLKFNERGVASLSISLGFFSLSGGNFDDTLKMLFIGAGMVSAAFAVVYFVRQSRWVLSRFVHPTLDKYLGREQLQLIQCPETELWNLTRWIQGHEGGEAVVFGSLVPRFEKSPASFWILIDERYRTRGGIIVFGLTKATILKLNDAVIRSGGDLVPRDICSFSDAWNGAYITYLGADSLFGQAAVIYKVRTILDHQFAHLAHAKIYFRAVNEESERLARTHKSSKLNANPDMSVITWTPTRSL